jgi:hypothetical protein
MPFIIETPYFAYDNIYDKMNESLSIFLKEIEHYSYGEKYRRW